MFAVALVHACSAPDGPPGLAPTVELGRWLLPAEAPATAELGGVRAEVTTFETESCGGLWEGTTCGAVELRLEGGSELRTVLLDPGPFGRASGPVWLDPAHVVVGVGDHGGGKLVVVAYNGRYWEDPVPLLSLDGAWVEPVRVVGGRLVLRVTAARRHDASWWQAATPAELRDEATSDLVHRLYLVDPGVRAGGAGDLGPL